LFKNLLKILIVLVLLAITGLLLLGPILKSNLPKYPNLDKCISKGTLELICDLQNPEDFAEIPNEDAVIVSQFAGLAELNDGETKVGLLSHLNLKTMEITDYEISFIQDNELGIGDKDCKPYKNLFPHGIDTFKKIPASTDEKLSPFLEEAHLLAVVNHEERDRIEYFLFFSEDIVFSDSAQKELFWVGCVEAPDFNTYFNDVVISDEYGSFYATHQYNKDWNFSKLEFFNTFRLDTGFVYKWDHIKGFSKLKNSGGAWPNGIEMIDEIVFVSYRMNGMVSAFNGSDRKDFKFRTYLNGGSDNIIAKDNALWVAVQNSDLGGLTCMRPDQVQCATPFSVLEINKDLKLLNEFDFNNVAFGGLSAVYPYSNKLILGSYKSDRIAIYEITD